MPLNILGISALYHESACCLIQDGKLIAATAEERLTRVKHDARLPINAFYYCLEAGNITVSDIDCIAFYESPQKKQDRQLWSGRLTKGGKQTYIEPDHTEKLIQTYLGYEKPVRFYDHHLSHAASAFFYSGFTEAAILTIDGVGEWATTTYGSGNGNQLEIFEEVRFPHSLGLLYAALTSYLGFRVNRGEYKVMGLAAYGQPLFVDHINQLIQSEPAGQFSLDMTYFDFVSGNRMYSEQLPALFKQAPRQPDSTIEPFHQDVARSLQVVLEELLLKKVAYLSKQVQSSNLCLAGGVALNSVANGRLRRESPFEELFIQPAAGDAGGCLGAAALAHIDLTGTRHTYEPLTNVYLGPAESESSLMYLFQKIGVEPVDYRNREQELCYDVAGRLEQGQIIGWFQGRMELGPRALGARSILANPMIDSMQDTLNERIKKREGFRPFAPTVLAYATADHFDLNHPSPFMLETCQVTSDIPLPAITHVDGSARPQTLSQESNPRFFRLLEAFYKQTSCPILLNTSLNIRGEPIVSSAVDAILCLARADLDALVVEDFLIERSSLPKNWDTWNLFLNTTPQFAFKGDQSAISESLYTFV